MTGRETLPGSQVGGGLFEVNTGEPGESVNLATESQGHTILSSPYIAPEVEFVTPVTPGGSVKFLPAV